MKVPYWLPLALFCGIVSQFVPTIGTYLGGALPIVFAWGSNGFASALAVLVFVTIYQQIENMVISPKISEKTMDLNPAVAFLSVLVMGAVFGALGAFLALPVTASLQAILKVCTKQYKLVDSPLMNDPKPNRKSIMVTSVEAIGNSFVKPVKDKVLRVMKGSSSRVSINEDIMYWYKQAYVSSSDSGVSSSDSSSDSSESQNSKEDSGYIATMAISRDVLDAVNRDIAKKRAENADLDSGQADRESQAADGLHANAKDKSQDKSQDKSKANKSATIPNESKNKKSNTNTNPRSGWNK